MMNKYFNMFSNTMFSLFVFYCLIICDMALKINASGVVGNRCERDSDCFENLNCVYDTCRCQPKFVQYGQHCFQEALYGEICWFDEQCIDHRQVCVNTTEGPKRCTCDMYHEYNDTVSQCSPKENLTALLEEKYNTFIDISDHAKKTFYGIMVIGLVVAGIGFLCCILASIYCCRVYKSDKRLEKDLNALIIKKGGRPVKFIVYNTEVQRKSPMEDHCPMSPVISGPDMVI